jgi:hypothetical protein
MAKAKGDGESKSQIFRRYFEKRPDLLKESSFDDVAAMYKEEYPNRDFGDNDRQIAANIKSKLRKELKIGRRRRRRRGRPAGATAAAAEAGGAPRGPRGGGGALFALEGQIDDCLIAARRLGRPELDDVVKHLRRARNLVIVTSGERE